MYRKTYHRPSSMDINKSYAAETIEQKVFRIVNNKEPISDGAPRIYTERKDGVQAQYNIRTDRFEIAVEAMDKVAGTHRAKREERAKTLGEQAVEGMKKEAKDGGTEPIQGTDGGAK